MVRVLISAALAELSIQETQYFIVAAANKTHVFTRGHVRFWRFDNTQLLKGFDTLSVQLEIHNLC